MPAADFPNSPSVGQSFTVDNKTYEWNGTYWEMAISTATIADGSIEGVKLAPMSASNGDYLQWDGTEWGPDAINLGTDTTGNYVQSLVAGNNITLSNNTGEGATPTINSGMTISDTMPSSPTPGQVWYESDTGKTFVYYDSFWVEVSGGIGAQGVTGPSGPAGAQGPGGDSLSAFLTMGA